MFNEDRKKIRLLGTDAISNAKYNGILGLVVLYGLFMNIILCVFFGRQSVQMMTNSPHLLLLIYFILCIAGSVIANKSDNPWISFLGYNMIVLPIGIIVSGVVGTTYLPLVLNAVKMTFAITIVIIVLSCLFPDFFLSLGKALFISLLALIAVSILFVFLRISSIWVAYFGAGIFTLYIGYDIQKAQQYPKTVDNAVDCAIDIYLDIINLFLRILEIMSKNKK